jgi:hypothetical protein
MRLIKTGTTVLQLCFRDGQPLNFSERHHEDACTFGTAQEPPNATLWRALIPSLASCSVLTKPSTSSNSK